MSKDLDELIKKILLEREFPFSQEDFQNPTLFNKVATIKDPQDEFNEKDLDFDEASRGKAALTPKNIDIVKALAYTSEFQDSQKSREYLQKIKGNSTSPFKKFIDDLIDRPTLANEPTGNLLDFYAAVETDPAVPSLDVPQKATERSKFEKMNIKSLLPAETLSVFNKFFEGTKSSQGRIEKLIEYSDAFEGAYSNDAASIKLLQAQDPSDVLAASMVLKYASMCIKEINSMEAGKFFETFTALLMGGVVVGSGGGAEDVLTGENLNVYTSQKLYKDLTGVSQAEGSRDEKGSGIYGATDKRIVYYLIGIKKDTEDVATSKNTDIAAVDIYLCGITRKGALESAQYFLRSTEGTALTKIQVTNEKNPRVLLGEAIDKYKEECYLGKLAIAAPDNPEAFRSVDVLLNEVFKNINSTAIKAFSQATKNINKVQNSTTKYATTSKGIKVSEQMKEAGQIITGYQELRQNLKDVISGFTLGSAKGTAKSKSAELDSLIESIINKKLLK